VHYEVQYIAVLALAPAAILGYDPNATQSNALTFLKDDFMNANT